MANYKLVNSDQLDTDMKTVADKIREKAQLSDLLSWPTGYVEGIDLCSSLNFSVVGGSDEPSDPNENTFWVKTDTDITSWALSPAKPNAPSDGMVWISVASSGKNSFNALKVNEIMIYPLSAKQYINDEWKNVDYSIYQNESWVEIKSGLIIYDSGTFGKDESGTAFSAECSDDGGGNDAVIDKQGSFMNWSIDSGNVGLFYITPKIDCSAYKTLNISISNATEDNSGNFKWGLASSTDATNPNFEAQQSIETTSAEQDISLDVSSVGGSTFYVAMQIIGDNDNFSLDVKKIWLE